MRFWSLYFDFGPYVFLAAVVVLFVRRRLRSTFPLFFASMLFQLVYVTAVAVAYAYALTHPPRLSYMYQWVVTSGLAIQTIFELAVLYEICDHLFLPSIPFSSRLRKLLSWIAAIVLLSSSVSSAILARVQLTSVVTVFQTLDFSSNLIKIGLLLVLLLFTRVLGISWRSLPAEIALGFGISAAAEIAASALISQPGRSGYVAIDLIRGAAFHACVLVWLIYVLLPEKPRRVIETGLQLADIENHMQELQRMVRR